MASPLPESQLVVQRANTEGRGRCNGRLEWKADAAGDHESARRPIGRINRRFGLRDALCQR
jgi:hypothetical protein